jgi:hypothetical protein
MNLKIFISFILMSHTVFTFASDNQIDLCTKGGEEFGNGLGRDEIPAYCYDLFKKTAALEAIKTGASGKVFAFGYKNIVFNKQDGIVRTIAGSNAQLGEVIALATDEANNEIAVLDTRGDVLIFPSRMSGNIAPYRILKHKDLHGASDLMINAKKNEVIVFNHSKQSLIFFPRLANNHGRGKKKAPTVLRVVRNLVSIESVTIDEAHQELFTLDTVKNRINVLSLDNASHSPAPVRTLALPSSFKNARKIEYSIGKDQIIVTNAGGETVAISR